MAPYAATVGKAVLASSYGEAVLIWTALLVWVVAIAWWLWRLRSRLARIRQLRQEIDRLDANLRDTLAPDHEPEARKYPEGDAQEPGRINR